LHKYGTVHIWKNKLRSSENKISKLI